MLWIMGSTVSRSWSIPVSALARICAITYSLIRNLEIFHCLDRPLLLGASRKRFIGAVLDRPVQDREVGTAVVHSFAIAAGVHIIRTHDVAFHRQVALMSDAVREAV